MGISDIQIAWHLINNFYVDSVDSEILAREAIKSMLVKLDPHSVLIPAEEVKAMNEPLDGNFEGVGIEFSILKDTLIVITPIVGGPSEEVGIRSGDRIIAIDGINIASIGLKNSDVFSMLRGKKGSKVELSVLRKNTGQLLSFIVTRDKIPIYSLDASYMATPKTGYIKLSRFSATTHNEFISAIKDLKSSGMANLILDLRGNGGGYLKAALDIADEFFDSKRMLLYTEGEHMNRREHNSSRGGLWVTGELLIILDEGSASASEIVAGAVQDWDRGVVIGRRSFGKGLVQRPFGLSDGSEIRLTIANYYTPSGRSIQKPYNNGIDEYRSEVGLRYSNGELSDGENSYLDDAQQYETLISKRPVYGGGGIIPDVFVPIDTSYYSDYYRKLVATGLLNQVAMAYTDQHRFELKEKYFNFISFNKFFTVEDDLLQSLVQRSNELDIIFDEQQFEISGNFIKMQLKALIARDIWGSSEYYQVLNPMLTVFTKAIELIENQNLYSEILN